MKLTSYFTMLLLGIVRYHGGRAFRPSSSHLVGGSLGSHCASSAWLVDRGLGRHLPASDARRRFYRMGSIISSNVVRYVSSTTSSTFQAPEPPQSKGQAVYSDIELQKDDDESSISQAASLRNNDPNAVFVVTGANRGIGLEFVKQLSTRTKGTILACCRTPESANDLKNVICSLPDGSQQRIQMIPLDLENQDSIEQATNKIKTKYQRVDMLLNVAGILGDGGPTTPGPERSISKIDRNWMEKTFAVNLYGPVMFSQGLSPLMQQRKRRSSTKDVDEESQRPNSIIANLSARVGSISDNELGGWYSYRMSKSALNQATRTMAHELKRQNVWCISLHPGTTDTDLSKPFQKNVQKSRLFPVDFTVNSLLNVIESMDDANSGGLYDWAGKAIPF